MHAPAPSVIRLHRRTRMLEVAWPDGTRFELPCEYLRVYSPSAELRGHGLPEPMLVGGKR
ncbi:MAG: gamma-butyrobetaine hydroxylase-like domain-containing protein, partial [Gammaproteobacteria bacterium]